MPSQWYYTHNDEEHGPVSTGQLKQMAGAGKLRADDLVWKEGMSDWVAASRVGGLFGSQSGIGARNKAAAKPAPKPAPARKRQAAPAAPAAPAGPKAPSQAAPASDNPFANLGVDSERMASRGRVTEASPYTSPSARLRSRGRSSSHSGAGLNLPILVGGVVLLLGMFVPWWGVTMYKPSGRGPSPSKAAEIQRKHRDFYERHERVMVKKMRGVIAGPSIVLRERVSVYLYGWDTVSGILSLVLGIPVIVVAILGLTVEAVKNNAWISGVAGAMAGLVMAIMGIVWFATAPGEDLPGVKQGISVGPILAAGAGIALVVLGIMAMVSGMSGGRRRASTRRAYR